MLKQTFAITAQNLKSLKARSGNSLVAIAGVAGVVLVFVAVLSMAAGFQRTMASGGDPGNVIALRSGATSELDSGLSGEQARIIRDAPGVAQDENGPLVSGELYVVVSVEKEGVDTSFNIPLRGVEPQVQGVRPHVEIREGRWFEPGRQELIVGQASLNQFAGLNVGQTMRFGEQVWDVVGVFSAGGGIHESELWADVRVLQGAYRRGNGVSSVSLKLADPAGYATLADHLNQDPRLSLKLATEPEYYAEQSGPLTTFIKGAGYAVAILMALGAVFGAINTMYTAVSERSREIATLRALGFANFPIVVSVMVEALLLAAIGGVVGGLLAWALFNGFTVSTLNFSSFSQVVFGFAVTPQLLTQGVILGLVIGFFGSLLPAIRAARLPVSTALRES